MVKAIKVYAAPLRLRGVRREKPIRKGSALIITILIVTVLATVAFSLSALAISDFRKTANLQDSIGAYYAAESGIEQGLMEYRLWHDAEISHDAYADVLNNQPIASDHIPLVGDSSAPQNFNLDGGQKAGLLSDSDRKGFAWYGLKISYKGTSLGALDAQGNVTADSPRIKRDSALNITVNGASQGELSWQPDPDTLANLNKSPQVKPFRYFTEVAVTNQSNGQLQRRVFNENDQFQLDRFPVVPASSIRITAWNMNYMSYMLDFKDNHGNNVPFDNGISYVEATGNVGSAQRKLKVGINRTSGTVLENSDFLLFSGDGSIVIQ